MPRLLPNRFATECVREFELAALARHADANCLADTGRRTGAIYLYGYTVEMLLKAAYFRSIGFADDRAIGWGDLSGAVGNGPASQARLLGLPGTRNFHDLSAWASLIVAYRSRYGPGYTDPGFAASLADNTAAVHARWTEVIRYHRNTAYAHELQRVRAAADWFVARRAEM